MYSLSALLMTMKVSCRGLTSFAEWYHTTPRNDTAYPANHRFKLDITSVNIVSVMVQIFLKH